MPMVLDYVHSLELITSVKFTYVEHEFYIFPHQIFFRRISVGELAIYYCALQANSMRRIFTLYMKDTHSVFIAYKSGA